MIFDQKLEYHLLSGLLRKPEEYLNIQPFFSEQDIYAGDSLLRQSVFSLIKRAVESGESVDATIIAQRLESLGITFDEEISAGKFVESLAFRSVPEGSVYKTAIELKKLSERRKTIEAMGRAVDKLKSLPRSASITEIQDIVDKEVNSQMSQIDSGESGPVNIYDDLEYLIEDRGNNPIKDFGMMGPYKRVNEIYGSLVRPGNITVIVARAKSGKMQPLYSRVLTPTGWKTMGEIQKGDMVMSENLEPVMVSETFEHKQKDIYRISFKDGRIVDCGKDHLWKVWARSYKNSKGGLPDWQVIDTEEIIRKLSLVRDRVYVPLISPVDSANVELPLDPYFMGALIGDGCLREKVAIESSDPDIIEKCMSSLGDDFYFKKRDKEISKSSCYNILCKSTYRKKKNPIWIKLEELGLAGKYSYEKEIPEIYLNSSLEQKMELIRGLMDTDGTLCVKKSGEYGSLEYSTSSEKLAKQVQNLIWSIGGWAKIAVKKTFYKDKNGEKIHCRPCYRVRIKHPNSSEFFFCKRKKDKTLWDKKKITNKVEIVKIEKLENKEDCKCLEIKSDSRLYITDNFIVTHNTTIALDYTTFVADKYNVNVLHFDNGEMSKEELQFRQAAALTGVPLYLLETGQWRQAGEAIITKVRDGLKRAKKLKFYYYCVGGMSPDEMVAAAKKFYYSVVGRGKEMILSFDYLKSTGQLTGNNTEYQFFGEVTDKFKKLIQKDILFDNKPMISLFTSVQSNRSGIVSNRRPDQINDDESQVGGSDKIIQLATHLAILRKKTTDEILEDGEQFGTHKLIFRAARHLGQDTAGHLEPVKDGDRLKDNFINLSIKNFIVKECGDLRDIVEYKQLNTSLEKTYNRNEPTDF